MRIIPSANIWQARGYWSRGKAGLIINLLSWIGLIIYSGYLALGPPGAAPVQAQSGPKGFPELTVEISDAPDPVDLNDLLTYKITVSNQGTAEATHINVTSQLDENVAFVSAGNEGSHTNGVVEWQDLGTLGIKEETTLTVQVRVERAPEKVLVNPVIARSAEGAINCETETTEVVGPRLILTKTADPPTANPGQTMTYTLVLANAGDGRATDIILTDYLADTLYFVSASDGGKHDGVRPNGRVVWRAPSLAARTAMTRTLLATVTRELTECQALVNEAAVTSSQTLTTQTSITTTTGKSGVITVRACKDENADGQCGPGGPLPPGVEACLTGSAGQVDCQPAPAQFSRTQGVFTTTLQFTGASQGYYPTTPPQRIELAFCKDEEVDLGAVYPVHPKGVAVHAGLNKVYVAVQGRIVLNKVDDPEDDEWPYPFVAVIDGDTDRVVKTIPGGPNGIGRQPWGVAVSGDLVYVGSFGEGRISILDPASDTIIKNENVLEQPNLNRPQAQFIAPAVTPGNGQVAFVDFQGYLVTLAGTNRLTDERIIVTGGQPGERFIASPFEVAVAVDGQTGQRRHFVTLRDALEFPDRLIPFKMAGVTSKPFNFTYYDIVEDDGQTTGSPHAIGLWAAGPNGRSRLFVTYSDEDPRDHFGNPDYFPNPGRLLLYEFPAGNPQAVNRVRAIDLDRDYAEVGLIYDPQVDYMVGTYAGFAYRDKEGDVAACNPNQTGEPYTPGGTYALDFEGQVVPGETDDNWRLPRIVVGSPPLESNTLAWKNPFELAFNPNNGKVYVTDRCWNEYPGGGGQPGGGAVLIYFNQGPSFLPSIFKAGD